MAAIAAPKLGASGNVNLPEEYFGAEWNEHLVWHVVRNELLWRRQGSHSVKTRGKVKGGSAKPWRQKGTGRARQGTTRAPQWRGGGSVFGPAPRKYGGKVNRKERAKAMKVALSLHHSRGSLAVLADGAIKEVPSAKEAAKLRGGWKYDGATRKLTVVCTLEQEAVWKSWRNLDDVQVVPATDLEVADVMWGRGLVLTEAAVGVLSGGAK
jgi:large subunit ribosomal protein L4